MGHPLLTNLGPCEVRWYDVTLGTDFGYTEGDVIVRLAETHATVQHDQKGTAAVDGVITGTTLEIETPLSDLSAGNVAKLFSAATLTPVTGQEGMIQISAGVGTYMLQNAQRLELTRYDGNAVSSDPDDVFRAMKAFPVVEGELAFGKETQRLLNVRWVCFPSQDTGEVGVVAQIGPNS